MYLLMHLSITLLLTLLLCSMVGIGYAKSLEYLDLSDNNISMIEGIEPLVSLKSLLLKENRIATAMSIRALSLNTNLIELDLRNNPICAASVTPREYKILVQTMVLTYSLLLTHSFAYLLV